MKKEKLILIITSIITICALVAIGLQVVRNGFIKSKIKVEGDDKDVQYSKTVVSDAVMQYVITQEDVIKQNGKNKKIAVYYTGKDCPFALNMQNTIEGIKNQEEYSSKYAFHLETDIGSKFFVKQEDALAYMEFNNLCQQFCIVNPEKKQILKIENMDNTKAEEIPAILKQFKDW